jgi:Protein of unknown function (DUF3999)
VKRALPLAAVLAVAAATAAPFRYSRPIEAPSGWARLSLPDDVLDACRRGLPDLRIQDEAGKTIPYAFEQSVAAQERRLAVLDLEASEKEETSGLIDRGESPGVADAVTFEINGQDFLKPVRIQTSDDRVWWKDAARGSIFATAGVRMLTVSIPPTDRRYLRFRLDDRNGDPVRPEALRVRPRVGDSGTGAATQKRPLLLLALPSDSEAWSRYSTTLPAANLAVTVLRFQAGDPAFVRRVRVFERVLFRDEVCRRLIAEGELSRAPGSTAPIDLPVSEAAGRTLEIDIENGDSPPLENLTADAIVAARTLRFFAPEHARLKLVYGSASAPAPTYDLGRALASGSPAKIADAALGAPAEAEPSPAPVALPPRVPLADAAAWTRRRPIVLPASGSVAYLDFDELPRGFADLRIVDETNAQVPFIVEQGSHEHRRKAVLAISNEDAKTRARLEDAGGVASIDAVELSVSAPAYFSRDVSVVEDQRDARGVTGTRRLGGARWERKPGEPAPVLRIPIGRPASDSSVLIVEVENDDNVPLTLTGAEVLRSSSRIDFVFRPGERLFLLSGNPESHAPRYDFELLAATVLASPAEAARLGRPNEAPAAKKASASGWLWGAIGVTVFLLLFALARTLRGNPTGA